MDCIAVWILPNSCERACQAKQRWRWCISNFATPFLSLPKHHLLNLDPFLVLSEVCCHMLSFQHCLTKLERCALSNVNDRCHNEAVTILIYFDKKLVKPSNSLHMVFRDLLRIWSDRKNHPRKNRPRRRSDGNDLE